MGFFISLVLLLHAPVAQAEDCPTLRLDQKGGSMDGVPTRDQGDLGICYAVVASQIYDSWRRANPSPADASIGRFSSPLYASVQSALDEKSNKLRCPDVKDAKKNTYDILIEIGHTCQTLEQMFGQGACSEEALQKALWPSDNKNKLVRERLDAAKKTLALDRNSLERLRAKKKKLPQHDTMVSGMEESLRNTEELIAELQLRLDAPGATSVNMVRKLYNDKLLLELCTKWSSNPTEDCLLGELGAEPKPIVNMKDQVKTLAVNTLSDFKSKLDSSICKQGGKVQFAPGKCAPSCQPSQVDGKADSHMNRIREQISKPGNLPVALDICSAAFRPDGLIQAWQAKDKITVPANGSWLNHPKCGLHAVMIIGQQKNPVTNKCQLVLRNSWGPACGGSCNNKRCSCEPGSGNILIDADFALTNTRRYSVISDKKECK
ncbi:MAG TPA: hypothetical protein DCS07_17360 [Bdellovibrionales bacterium]|nr:MAG: hypothetical protein A2070_12930 [Bdellovibrionales bacterium GWC1_52_8]HAR44369.1 hypothetical protein [Bdellovibrionales bacterium]